MEDSDLDHKRRSALQHLRPVCLALMKDKTTKNVQLLIQALSRVDAAVTQEIQQYILFPIQNALHLKVHSDGLLCSLCQALLAVLSKSQVVLTQTFWDCFNPLILSMTSPDGHSKVSTHSEDTRAAIVNTLTCLWKAAIDRVLTDVYSFNYLPAIGQQISLMLQIAENEKSHSLQVAALQCILVVLQTGTKYGRSNKIHLGDLFAFCLPGVTTATCKIATGDSKQGQAVLSKALHVWWSMVTLILSDEMLAQAQAQKKPISGKQKEDPVSMLVTCLDHRQDPKWLKTSTTQLDAHIAFICKLVSSSNWRVRMALVDLCQQVLMACSKTLSKSVPKLLECLVAMIGDDYGNVAQKCQATFQTFAQSQSGTAGERTVLHILEENLYNLTTCLPGRMRMCDEEDKPALINLLNGYIRLLGPNIGCLIHSSSHLSRLCLALVQALELDTSDLTIAEERRSLLDNDGELFTEKILAQVWLPKKYFKFFQDKVILSGLMTVCRQLGQHGDLSVLVDHVLEVYYESSIYQLSAVLIINEMVLGSTSNMQEEKDVRLVHDVVKMLLDEYMLPQNFQQVDGLSHNIVSPQPPSSLFLSIVKAETSWESQKNLTNRNRAVLLIVFVLEGVGHFAKALGKGFCQYLMTVLYPLLENLGHENVHISSTAYASLMEVARACGYQSLDSLIRDNADYLVSSVSLRLRHFDKNCRVSRTVCVMLRYCSEAILPLIEHSLTELLDSIDDNYSENLVLFMPVLYELTTAIARWYPSTTQLLPGPSMAPSASFTPDTIVVFIQDYIQTQKLAAETAGEGDGERTLQDIEAEMKKLLEEKREGEEREESDKEDEEKKIEIPKHVHIVQEVLHRIKNLLSSYDARLRIQALNVLCQGCQDLRDYERELLPQIHQFWEAFYPMFKSEEKFVIMKAMTTLQVMSELCGDFLQHRTMKDVIPGLAVYMDKQSKISSGSRSAYLNTSHYKLQLSILSSLGPIAKNLTLGSNHLHQVAKICLPYLSNLQPVALQKASRDSWDVFISLDCSAMWLLLSQTYCPQELEPPGQDFQPVQFPCGPGEKNSYCENISHLFNLHYS